MYSEIRVLLMVNSDAERLDHNSKYDACAPQAERFARLSKLLSPVDVVDTLNDGESEEDLLALARHYWVSVLPL